MFGEGLFEPLALADMEVQCSAPAVWQGLENRGVNVALAKQFGPVRIRDVLAVGRGDQGPADLRVRRADGVQQGAIDPVLADFKARARLPSR